MWRATQTASGQGVPEWLRSELAQGYQCDGSSVQLVRHLQAGNLRVVRHRWLHQPKARVSDSLFVRVVRQSQQATDNSAI